MTSTPSSVLRYNSCEDDKKNKVIASVFTIAMSVFIALQILNYINPCSKNGSLDSWIINPLIGEIFILVAFIIENLSKLFKWNNSKPFSNGLSIYLPAIGINVIVLLSTIQQYFQSTYYCENIYG